MTFTEFLSEFESATLDNKILLLNNATQVFDLHDESIKDTLSICKDEILDLQIEEDLRCNQDIDAGILELYTCTKSVDNYKEDQRYYVRVDDMAKDLSEKWSDTPFMTHIKDIPVVYWIYSDSGLGTLKSKSAFKGDFSEYFNK
jgi:hypothetical protein